MAKKNECVIISARNSYRNDSHYFYDMTIEEAVNEVCKWDMFLQVRKRQPYIRMAISVKVDGIEFKRDSYAYDHEMIRRHFDKGGNFIRLLNKLNARRWLMDNPDVDPENNEEAGEIKAIATCEA